MIIMFLTFCGWFFMGMIILIELFLTLCLDVFTVPAFLISWLFCKLSKTQTPHIRLYGLMLYPSWNARKRRGLIKSNIAWYKRQTESKRTVPCSIEEMYLYDKMFGDK